MLNIIKSGRKKAIGLMSGTSQDGIDAALLEIEGFGKRTRFELLEFDTYDYPKRVKDKLHDITTSDKISLHDLARLNYAIGKCFASSAIKICEKQGIKTKDVDFIGSHGQTLIHLPKETDFCGIDIKATLQVGEPSIIAKETGILTVADFRHCHIALGGEGAPLTPYTDYIIFSSKRKSRAVINIGGITNITVLPKGCSLNEIRGYDVGPGNMCIDEAMRALYKTELDVDGLVAKSGRVSPGLLERLLENQFFSSGLTSTGRLHFGAKFVNESVAYALQENIRPADIIATFTELTSYKIAEDVNKQCLDEVIVCGGGYKNPALMEGIISKCNKVRYRDISEFGMGVDSREAIAFAILANEALAMSPSNIGLKRGVLGKIVLP